MKNKINILTNIVFILYLLLLVWLILFKFATRIDMIPHLKSINIIPFGDSIIVNGKIYLKEIIYNIIVFIPFGVYVSIIKDKWDLINKILVGFGLSLLFEIIQYIFSIGGSDITDLMGNTFGTFLGICLYFLLKKAFKNNTNKIINIIGLIIELCAIGFLILLTLSNK